jgi:hypothetical protein
MQDGAGAKAQGGNLPGVRAPTRARLKVRCDETRQGGSASSRLSLWA